MSNPIEYKDEEVLEALLEALYKDDWEIRDCWPLISFHHKNFLIKISRGSSSAHFADFLMKLFIGRMYDEERQEFSILPRRLYRLHKAIDEAVEYQRSMYKCRDLEELEEYIDMLHEEALTTINVVGKLKEILK